MSNGKSARVYGETPYHKGQFVIFVAPGDFPTSFCRKVSSLLGRSSSPCPRYELLAFKIAAGGAGPSSLRAVTVNLPACFSGIPWPRAVLPPLLSKPECLFSSTPRNVGGKQSPQPIIAEPIHTTAYPIGPRRHETAVHGALVLPPLILFFGPFAVLGN
jgi:hypothetical protein